MYDEIKGILVDELGLNPNDITPVSNICDDLGINSIELANVVLALEDKYDVIFKEEDMRTLLTVSDLVKYIENQRH